VNRRRLAAVLLAAIAFQQPAPAGARMIAIAGGLCGGGGLVRLIPRGDGPDQPPASGGACHAPCTLPRKRGLPGA
jgi:hypothetical protein